MEMTMEPTGAWQEVIEFLAKSSERTKDAVGKATKDIGDMIVATIKNHFKAQDLGWAPHKQQVSNTIFNSSIKRIRKSSKKNIMSRLTRLNIPYAEAESKETLAARLATGGNQILIDSGTLMNSFTFTKLDYDKGQVGANRQSPNGANLVAVHEFGSPRHKIPARPFFKPTAIEVGPKIREMYGNAIKEAFRA